MKHTHMMAIISITASSAGYGQGIQEGIPDSFHLVAHDGNGQPIVAPSDQLIAGLVYDGSSSAGARAQDFESQFDLYDLFLIEDFEITTGASLGVFQSAGFGSVDPFMTTDVPVSIYTNDGSGLPGMDAYTGELALESAPGTGFFDGSAYIADFAGQCLPPGSYYLVWAARLESQYGASFFRAQAGESTVGGGQANNAWWWNPGGAVFPGIHEPVIVEIDGDQTGVNYLLFGELANCSNPCANPDCPPDLDFDADADADDFFLFLDFFSAGDPCADLDASGTIDSADFFAYLDLFARGCP